MNELEEYEALFFNHWDIRKEQDKDVVDTKQNLLTGYNN